MGVEYDKTEILETLERNGTLQRVVRGYYVTNLTIKNAAAMMEALDNVNIPKYGDRLSTDPLSDEYALIVHQRQVNMEDEKIAKIVVTYENAYAVDNMEDNYDAPHLASMGGEVRCNVQQKTSNLDLYGNQIIVQHTYPADDENFPSKTIVQGGEVNYYAPQRSFMIHGIKQTSTPWLIANNVVGFVNAVPFSGEAPRTWLCMASNWKPESLKGGLEYYYMRFEFSFDFDTWDPTAVFIDSVTGFPPANLVPNVGYKYIERLPSTDFEWVIGTWIQGA